MKTKLGTRCGEKVRQHRDGLGLSQEALADRLGYHRTYIGAIERGERNLTFSSVEELAHRLGVTTEYLLTP